MNATPDTLLQDIATRLHSAFGLEATVEYPGCVVVWAEDLDDPAVSWWFGTANGTWQGDLNGEKQIHLGTSVDTNVPATETDSNRIAAAIAAALNVEEGQQ